MMKKSNIVTEEELETIEAETNFVLNDGGVHAQTDQLSFDQTSPENLAGDDSGLSLSSDIASDDEILAAEMEIDSADIQLNINLIKDFNSDSSSNPPPEEQV